MELTVTPKKTTFLLICLGLGILADLCFFHDRIGLSLLVFVIVLYSVIFLKYRLAFNHRRIGLLFTFAIWALSGSYLLYDHHYFYYLNLVIIPILIFAHLIIITSPNTFKWNTPYFLALLKEKLLDAIYYSLTFVEAIYTVAVKPIDQSTRNIFHQIMKGLIFSVPLFVVIGWLFVQADGHVYHLLDRVLDINILQWTVRFIFVLLFGLILFGIFQTLPNNSKIEQLAKRKPKQRWDGLTAMTIMIVLNIFYLLFIIALINGGFGAQVAFWQPVGELTTKSWFAFILITIINLSLLIGFLKLVKIKNVRVKRTLQVLYSLLIVINLFILVLAYQRLGMYEGIYGFTFSSILAHGLIIFLMVILAYTFVHVWLEKISLLHFYLILGLIFYTSLNVMNIEQIVVDKNIERYLETGQIDLNYLDSLSYTGWNGLITLYELGEDDPALLEILTERKNSLAEQPKSSWQSFNFTKQKVENKFSELK